MTLDSLFSVVGGGFFGGAFSVVAVLVQNCLKVREDRKDRELHANLLSVIVLPKMMKLLADLNNKRTILGPRLMTSS
jgi:hypothetical protein